MQQRPVVGEGARAVAGRDLGGGEQSLVRVAQRLEHLALARLDGRHGRAVGCILCAGDAAGGHGCGDPHVARVELGARARVLERVVHARLGLLAAQRGQCTLARVPRVQLLLRQAVQLVVHAHLSHSRDDVAHGGRRWIGDSRRRAPTAGRRR